LEQVIAVVQAAFTVCAGHRQWPAIVGACKRRRLAAGGLDLQQALEIAFAHAMAGAVGAGCHGHFEFDPQPHAAGRQTLQPGLRRAHARSGPSPPETSRSPSRARTIRAFMSRTAFSQPSKTAWATMAWPMFNS